MKSISLFNEVMNLLEELGSVKLLLCMMAIVEQCKSGICQSLNDRELLVWIDQRMMLLVEIGPVSTEEGCCGGFSISEARRNRRTVVPTAT